MNDRKMVTIEVEVDTELCEKARAVLEPQGITLEDALRMFIEYCADSRNREAVIAMINSWIEEDGIIIGDPR